MKIFQRGYVERVVKLRTIFGHDWAGDVVDVGSGMDWPRVGMRVPASAR